MSVDRAPGPIMATSEKHLRHNRGILAGVVGKCSNSKPRCAQGRSVAPERWPQGRGRGGKANLATEEELPRPIGEKHLRHNRGIGNVLI